MKKTILFLILTIFSHCNFCMVRQNEYLFSFQEIENIPLFEMREPHFLTASDAISLAYYSFMPKEPIAIVVLYHGAGLYNNNSYQWVGLQLQKEFNIGCYCVDVRGHGRSGGLRGDTPTIEQVWNDVDLFIENIRMRYPTLPLYLAGHSSGSGLLINHHVYTKHKDQINGYIFLAPYLGPNSGTLKEHENPQQSFVKKARIWVYILNSLLKWNFLQHIHSIFFNYPDFLLDKDPLIVPSYSYAMSMATTPYEIQKLFSQLDTPFALYIGKEDEQFFPEKIIKYKKDNAIAKIIPHRNHFSILLNASDLIAQSIWLWLKGK